MKAWLKGGLIGAGIGILGALIIYIFIKYLFLPLPACQGEECLGNFASGMASLLSLIGMIIFPPLIGVAISLLTENKKFSQKYFFLGGGFYLIILTILLSLSIFLNVQDDFMIYYFYFLSILFILSILTILIFVIRKIINRNQ